METLEKIKAIIADRLNVNVSEINMDKTIKDLGGDSLDAVDTMMELEKQFHISIPDDQMESLI